MVDIKYLIIINYFYPTLPLKTQDVILLLQVKSAVPLASIFGEK